MTNLLTFESLSRTVNRYSFETGGEIVGTDNIENSDEVQLRSASGRVWIPRATDDYEISGGLTSLEVDAEVRVHFNDELIAGGPKTVEIEIPETETVEVAVYTTRKLHQRHGRIPERVAALFLSRAFDRAGYSSLVAINHHTVDPPDETSHCSSETNNWWNRLDLEFDAKDSNVLLTDADSDGCGFVGGRTCTAPGRHLAEEVEWQAHGEGDFFDNVSTLLHEVGHNLGSMHDFDLSKPKQQHWGAGWNEGGKWHRTPGTVDNGTQNVCGEDVEERRHDDVVQHLYYHDCAVDRFQIR